MATLRQIESARRNGALSRGAVTDRGREISAATSRKHNVTAKKIYVLANESAAAFNSFVDSILGQYRPEGELERELCLNIAYAHWRLRRLSVVETGLFDREMTRHFDTHGGDDEGLRLANAFESLASANGSLSLLTHYETRLHRTVQRLIERLEKIQKKRKNEPDLAPLPVCDPTRSAPGNNTQVIETLRLMPESKDEPEFVEQQRPAQQGQERN